MKNGESAKKAGTPEAKKGESSKKRFGLKAKPPPPAPRVPRPRQRLSVTVLGLPNPDRPLLEGPLLAEITAKFDASVTALPATFAAAQIDPTWPSPAAAGATPAGETPADSTWPSPWPSPTVNEAAPAGAPQLDLSWPSPAPAPEPERPAAPRKRTAERPAPTPATKARKVRSETVATPPAAVPDPPVATVAVDATPVEPSPAHEPTRLEIPLDLLPAPTAEAPEPPPLDIPVDLSPTPPAFALESCLLEVPGDVSPTPPATVADPPRLEIPVDLSPTPPISDLPAPRPAARRTRPTAARTPAPTTPATTTPVEEAATAPAPPATPRPRPARANRTAAPPASTPPAQPVEKSLDITVTPPPESTTPTPPSPTAAAATPPAPVRRNRPTATRTPAPTTPAPTTPVDAASMSPAPSPAPAPRPTRRKRSTAQPAPTPPPTEATTTPAPVAQPESATDPIAAPGWPSPGEFWIPGRAEQAASADPTPTAADDGFRPYRQISERDARRQDGTADDQGTSTERMEEPAAAGDLNSSEWAAPRVQTRFFSAEAAAERDVAEPRRGETSGDGESTPMVLEIPGTGGRPVRSGDAHPPTAGLAVQPAGGADDWLEARLDAAERELHRVEMRTNGQNGDLRNARRREIAAAVRHALGDGELVQHFDLIVGNGRFAFQRRGLGVSAQTGPIRIGAAASVGVATEPVRADGLVAGPARRIRPGNLD